MRDNGRNDISKAYDRVAEEYAAAFAGEHEKKPKDLEMLQRFSQRLKEKGPVWDLGCGPGHTAGHLARLGLDVSGMDLSGKMLTQARRRFPDICFLRGDILNLALKDGALAGIVAFYAIVHFTKPQVKRALAELYRVLGNGGTVLLAYHVGKGALQVAEFLEKVFDAKLAFFTNRFISGCLEDCGFEEIEIIERAPYPGVEYQSRRAYVFARKPKRLSP
jgi:ubiquinone/menaquinone biosynthesis C-methylase UbiE